MMPASLLACIGCVQVIHFLALVVKPSPYRCLLIVPIVLAVVCFFGPALQYHTPVEYTLACLLLVQFFSASDHILLTDVQRELFLKGQKEPAFRRPLFERVKWATKLFIGFRCVGWAHEPTHALPRPSPCTTRWKFIPRQLLCIMWDLAVYEVMSTYTKNSPSFAADGYSIAGDGTFWLTVNVIAYGVCAIVSIDMPHRMLGIIYVGLGIAKPHEWIPLFGSLWGAYSLQNFWGRVWHQILRRQIVSHGHFFAHKVLRLKRNSLASLLVQVYVGFTISALIHLGGEYSMLGYWSHKHALSFFLLQAVGITIEIVVTEAARKLRIGRSWYWIGYIWVLAWFTYTLPDWVDPLFRAGMAETSSNLGILEGLWKLARRP